LFPSSGNHAFGTTELNGNQRESNDNGIGLVKLQYQKNINDRSYFRIFGYSNYSNWFINGPVSANLDHGGEIADYEVYSHGFGVNARYENQLNSQNLLTLTASYQTAKLQTYSNGSNGGQIITNLIDKNGNCYTPIATTIVNPATGSPVPLAAGSYASCFAPVGSTLGGSENVVTQYGSTPQPLIAGVPPAGSPAANNGAYWAVTENGQNAQIDTVTPFFTAYSLSDQFRPSDKLVINAGVRLENFLYRLNYDAGAYPARSFWYNAYNRENCYFAGQPAPTSATQNVNGTFAPCGAGSISLVDSAPSTVDYTAIEPRTGTTYTINSDTVLRASYGRYAQQPGTSYQLFNTTAQNSTGLVSQFLPYGYNSPYHTATPSYSNSYDFSLEKHLHGTDYSFKLTPFYRSTQDEQQSAPLGSQGVLDGLNTGTGRNYGVEFEFSKGDFGRQGLSYTLSYTYTNSKIRFGNFASGNNFIDNLNAYVKQYNGFTSFCTANPSSNLCGATPTGVAGSPCYVAGAPSACGAAGAYANPYWNSAPQPLFDRTAEYTPYDILPSAYQGANGFVVPNLITGVLNYRRGKLTLTPSATYSSGSFYGSPLTWPGYDPTTCAGASPGGTLQQSCTGSLFIPDVYTGKFDNQGAFREPTRLTANFQLGYEVTPRVRLTLTMTGLIDHCYQRGYAWDNASTCVYAQLPSNGQPPVGNFLQGTGLPTPPQLAYPYSSWYNNSQTGYVGQRIPFNAFFNVQVRL
jgi:hypothetical protein